MENQNTPQSKQSLKEEFFAGDSKDYKYKIGKGVASSLSGFLFGFIAGAIAIGLIWWAYTVSRVRTP